MRFAKQREGHERYPRATCRQNRNPALLTVLRYVAHKDGMRNFAHLGYLHTAIRLSQIPEQPPIQFDCVYGPQLSSTFAGPSLSQYAIIAFLLMQYTSYTFITYVDRPSRPLSAPPARDELTPLALKIFTHRASAEQNTQFISVPRNLQSLDAT